MVSLMARSWLWSYLQNGLPCCPTCADEFAVTVYHWVTPQKVARQ